MFSGSLTFLTAVIAYPRSYVRKEGTVFTQSIMAGKAQRQELEVAEHIAERDGLWGSVHFLFFMAPQPLEWCCPL